MHFVYTVFLHHKGFQYANFPYSCTYTPTGEFLGSLAVAFNRKMPFIAYPLTH